MGGVAAEVFRLQEQISRERLRHSAERRDLTTKLEASSAHAHMCVMLARRQALCSRAAATWCPPRRAVVFFAV